MTEREILLKKLSSYQFMVDDLKLYLDTHPNDTAAIMKLKEYKEMLMPLIDTFEKKYGPLKAGSNNTSKWKWINSPWPWEPQEDD